MAIAVTQLHLLGDIHGSWGALQSALDAAGPGSTVIQLGDFGYNPRGHFTGAPWPAEVEVQPGQTVYFLPGNHEDHGDLPRVEVAEVAPGIFSLPRGHTLLVNGLSILAVGGGESMDWHRRGIALDWFPEERVTRVEVESIVRRCADSGVDLIVSHDAPDRFAVEDLMDDPGKRGTPTRHSLNHLLLALRPRHWCFGHFHKAQTGEAEGCQWRCLGVDELHRWDGA